jgi:UDP-N-acetylglucosamine diphosphorylase/glucosamine-1-phosphate N-acetyltransferase
MNVLADIFEPTLQPLLRLKPLFLLRDGIFSPWQRAQLCGLKTSEAQTRRSQNETQALLTVHSALQNMQFTSPDTHLAAVKPADLLLNIGRQIEADLRLLDAAFTHKLIQTAQVEGDTTRVLIHPEAQVSAHAVIDVRNGPVVIDAGARISAFCLIQGPVYIGQKSQLDSCRISNSIVGENCRLGGEIADSVIGDFSNKHHDGFLGHSLVGDWVNLGALTTTSDLKNNYGEVRLTYDNQRYETGTIKLGSVIGDYAKTAIGTMLGTGCIVDFAANLFGQTHWSGHVPAFTWGADERYDLNLFARDADRMMQRRGRTVTPALRRLFGDVLPGA